jgi:glycosyltransferase involved in cell wall biosynthesis
MPKISVIIPSYNSAIYLPEAIESVLAQTYKDFEIIVIDDGSTDNTKDVVKPYLDRITFLKGPNGGPCKARNRGIRKSSGEFVAFLDADDIWYPDKLECQMAVFSKNPNYDMVHSDASYSRTYTSKEDRTWYSIKKCVKVGWVFSELLSECFIILSSVIVKRKSLERARLFDEHVERWHGYDLYLRIAVESQIGLVNKPLFFRRIHESNRFYSDPLIEVKSLIKVLKKWDNQAHNLADVDKKLVNQRLRIQYCRLGTYYLAREQPTQARKALKSSLARGFSPRAVAYLGLSTLPFFALVYIRKAKHRLSRKATNTRKF